MSFDTKLTKINPHCVDITKSSYGGTPELTGQDMLLSMVGCEPNYTELKTLIAQSTSCNPQFLRKETEDELIDELINYYKTINPIRFKKCTLNNDEKNELAIIAIYSQYEGMPSSANLEKHFKCSRRTIDSKYIPTIDIFNLYLYGKLGKVSSKANKRIKE